MMKKILSNIIFGIVICVFGYLSIANILHVIYLNKYESFDFSSKPMTDIKANIKELESNIDKISKLDNKVFTEELLKSIKSNFDIALQNIKSSKLLSYEGEQKIYFKDLFIIDKDENLSITGNINTLEELAKHDRSINDYLEVYKCDFVNNAYNIEAGIREVRDAYKYNTKDYFNAYIIESTNTGILSRVYSLAYTVVKENYLAKLVLEIGGGDNE
jgi:hypothetical protein